jgi:hypothetical protein
MIALGVYGSIYRGLHINASSAVESSVQFVSVQYKLPWDSAQLSTLTYNENDKTYTVEIRNKQAANEAYKITINGSSGSVTKAIKSP